MKYVAAERRNRLAQLIMEQGSVRIGDMAALFGVTNETIRKDLLYLDEQKIVCKRHGGAVAVSEPYERPLHDRAMENGDLKERIARKALELLENNSVIILDSGTTVLTLARMLAPYEQLTIVTNSFPAAVELTEAGKTVHMIGGEISAVTMSTSGMAATNDLNMVKADIAFLGTSGFQSFGGPSAKAFSQAQTKVDMIRNSRMHVVLADSSKFQTNAFVQFAQWSQIDYLITDGGAPEEALSAIEKQRCKILIV